MLPPGTQSYLCTSDEGGCRAGILAAPFRVSVGSCTMIAPDQLKSLSSQRGLFARVVSRVDSVSSKGADILFSLSSWSPSELRLRWASGSTRMFIYNKLRDWVLS